jgi:hypothetical protein
MARDGQGVPLDQIVNPVARTRELVWRAQRAAGPARRELLMDALGDDYPPLRRRAALLLADTLPEDPGAARGLRGLARREGGGVEDKLAAAAALALRGDATAETVAALREVFAQDASASVRYEALVSLFVVGEGGECAAGAIEDPDDDVSVVGMQVAAARGLTGLMGAIAARRERMRATTRLQATLSLVELEALQPGADEDRIAEWVEELARALKNEETSAAAARALGWLARTGHSAERARFAMRARLGSFLLHPILKVEIAAALTEAGDPEGVAHLERALASRRKDAKGYAIEVSGRLRLEPFYDTIARIARGDDYHNETAILAVAAYDTDASRALLAELARAHPDADCRALAGELLRDGTVSDDAADTGVLFIPRSTPS